MPGRFASEATDETTRPKTGDRAGGAADEGRSVERRPINAAGPGVPGTVMSETERSWQEKAGEGGQQSQDDRKHDQPPPHHGVSEHGGVHSSRMRRKPNKVKCMKRFRFLGQTG